MAEQPNTRDPLDLAAEMLFQVLGGLQESSVDLKKNEAARTCLMVAQATALIDVAKSMRAQTDMLEKIADDVRRMRS